MSLLVETKQISIYGVVISVCDIYIPTVGIDIDSIRSADIGSVLMKFSRTVSPVFRLNVLIEAVCVL